MHQSTSRLLQTTMAKTKWVKHNDAGNATGPTASTGVVEDSFVEDGVDDSEQVGTDDGNAKRAAGSGDTTGKKIARKSPLNKMTSPSSPLRPIRRRRHQQRAPGPLLWK